ncbi:type II toxin-antitoxin system RelE/ParE family toxin [Methylobacterium sp. SI9]|uniref:type II toxin-antitoxin system RelE family toxin n=1 Tax=Methylobacterium guangdongense TaxID=3138811 RepID=UPI00313CFF81
MDGEAAKSLVFTRAAARSLSRLPKDAEDLIREKLRSYAHDPGSLANNVKALKGEGKRLRLRVGNWRAIFTIEPDRIIVHAVGPRSTIYD